jgi:hypothetical protein
MPALSIRTLHDGVLGVIAPLGLALARDTALVVDLDPNGPAYPGSSSLADLIRRSPRRADLEPSRSGVAVLRNGGVDPDEAASVVEALAHGWPALVLRLGGAPPAFVGSPTLTVVPLLPGILAPAPNEGAVYQQTGFLAAPPGPGLILPRPSAGTVGRLLRGIVPGPSRWIRAWARAWEPA